MITLLKSIFPHYTKKEYDQIIKNWEYYANHIINIDMIENPKSINYYAKQFEKSLYQIDNLGIYYQSITYLKNSFKRYAHDIIERESVYRILSK